MNTREIINSYLPINPDGAALCPWGPHEMKITEETWSCEGCELKGDAADFVARYEHVDRRRAEEMIESARARERRTSSPAGAAAS